MSDPIHAHKYDLTSKSLFKDLELPLLEYVTGQSVQFQRYLDIQFQTISSQRADLVCEALLGQQEVVIHLEIQADNDPQMLYRMLAYLVDIHHQYHKPIYQCVVYLGAKPLNMPHQLCFELAESNKLDYRYQVLALNQVAFDELAALPVVDFMALLPLTQSEWDSEQHLSKSVELLVERSKGLDFNQRSDLLLKTEILAGLRYPRHTLSDLFEEAMQVFQLERSEGYQMILEKGIERGIQTGIERGIQTGRQEGLHEAEERFRNRILNILGKRFGAVPLHVADGLKTLHLEHLDLMLTNALDAPDLAAFISALQSK